MSNNITVNVFSVYKNIPFLRKVLDSIVGCNMAIPFSNLKLINGFDVDYEITGYGEECYKEWRILKQGFSFLHLKYRAIQFHLFHERPNREDQTAISRKLFNKKKQEGISFCKNGITKIKS